MRLIVYDTEVFCEDCLVVLKDMETGKYTAVHNDNEELKQCISEDNIYVGFNSEHYFGRDRLKALADEVNANIKEFYEDPEAGCYNIKRAIKQIGFDDNIGDIMDTLAVHDDLKAKLSRIKK